MATELTKLHSPGTVKFPYIFLIFFPTLRGTRFHAVLIVSSIYFVSATSAFLM